MKTQVNEIQQERLLKIILRPHVSEKSTLVAEKHRQFVFEVLPQATKEEIKHSVEHLFSVKVDSVRVANVLGKNRRFRQTLGKKRDWKKAYVALKPGFDIDFTGTK